MMVSRPEGYGQSTHLSESSSAVLADSLRSPTLFPWNTGSSARHKMKKYSEICRKSSLLIILSWSDRQRASGGPVIYKWEQNEDTHPGED